VASTDLRGCHGIPFPLLLELNIGRGIKAINPGGRAGKAPACLHSHPNFALVCGALSHNAYLNPPAHAAVFCVDEKTTIQALDRKDPVLPLSPGRAERHGFEYFRHGTLSLYAAFNTQTGEVLGKTAARHTSAEFVAFLADIVVNQARGKEIHVIADNLSTHKTRQVDDFLESHPHVHLHFTPTYSSWLNQVELWFAKIERDVIARGVFTSLADLRRKLMKYIRHYNNVPKTVKWRYFDPTSRITSTSAVTVH
jgi:transposase